MVIFKIIRIVGFILVFIFLAQLNAKSIEYIWRDGERLQTIYLNVGYIAEIQNGKQVKMMEVRDPKLKSFLSKGFLPKTHSNMYSEVFEEVEGGRKMTLPGDIFVEFKEDLDEKNIRVWADTQKLTLHEKINSTRNIYRIKTSPGIENIHLANKLLTQSEIKSAFPNWWRESSRR
ncbi:MAG: hypothetical protein KBF93_13445 [Leptospiraceae bacterium]|nr:hypothetical protein [Leptospiraceae bacterium]